MHSQWDAPRVAEIVGDLLEGTGLSQRGLARVAGFGEAQISRWLRGETQPSYDKLRDLARGIRERYPDLTGQMPALFAAAGYDVAGAIGSDSRPAIVRENWGDETVRRLWALDLPENERLGHIDLHLSRRAASAAAQADSDDSEGAGL